MKWNRNCSFVKQYVGLMEKKNVVNLNIHNSIEHELMKTQICYDLKKQGHTFSTETEIKFGDQKRIADVIDWNDRTIIEIQHTESDDSIRKKEEFFESLGFEFLRYKVKL